MNKLCWQCCMVTFNLLVLSSVMISPSSISAAEQTQEDEEKGTPVTARPTTRSQPVLHRTPQVAVIDIARLEKEDRRLRAAAQELKKQDEADQAALRKDNDALRHLERDLQQFEDGSEEHQQLTEKIALAAAELVVKRLKFEEEHKRQEASAYYQFHHQVNTEIAYFAQRYGIHLVLPYDSSELGPDASKDEILDRMKTNPLSEGKIDITDDILQRMGPPGCLPPTARGFPTAR